MYQAAAIKGAYDLSQAKYDYLTTKFGIKPTVASKTSGRPHQQSFKNVLSIGIANSANEVGLSVSITRDLLIELRRFERKHKTGLFEPNHPNHQMIARAYYVKDGLARWFFIIAGNPVEVELCEVEIPNALLADKVREARKKSLDRYEKSEEHQAWLAWLNGAESYSVINIDRIKEMLLERLA